MNSLISKLGPGLMYAGAAVGVSHIVQSTKAGAIYGWSMILVVVLANLFKYPFFEAGPRYANATGKSLLDGYKKLGNWSLWMFLILTLGTMFIVQAAVTIVTAGLAVELFGLNIKPNEIWLIALSILLICSTILVLGKTKILDYLMKWVMLILSITTIFAFLLAFNADIPQKGVGLKFDFSEGAMLFLISLIGWMPAPLDISVWHSIWSANNGSKNLKNGLFDFKIGYWGTMILALLFVGLGTLMIHGTGIALEKGAGAFASQLINIYTSALGDWSYYLIAIAAFTTMFSTTLSCLDAYGRILKPTFNQIKGNTNETYKTNNLSLLLTVIGASIILKFFVSNMADLVLFITILSFVSAPIIAILNHLVIHKVLSPEFRPASFVKTTSYIGIMMMLALSVYFVSTL